MLLNIQDAESGAVLYDILILSQLTPIIIATSLRK